MMKKPQQRKFNERSANSIFKYFKITKIATFDSPSLSPEFERRKPQTEITLESFWDNSKILFTFPGFAFLDDYGQQLYNFILNLPKYNYWRESVYIYNGNNYTERIIQDHDE